MLIVIVMLICGCWGVYLLRESVRGFVVLKSCLINFVNRLKVMGRFYVIDLLRVRLNEEVRFFYG